MSIHAHRKPPAVLMGQPSLWPGEAVKPVEPTPTPDADAGEAAATAVPTHAKPGRRRTPSFVCEVPLRVGPAEEQALQARLEAARALYNACLEEARRRWGLLRQSKAYQQARRLPRHTPAHPGTPRSAPRPSMRRGQPTAFGMRRSRSMRKSAVMPLAGLRSIWTRP